MRHVLVDVGNRVVHHGRADSLVQEQVEKMKAQLDRVLATYRLSY